MEEINHTACPRILMYHCIIPFLMYCSLLRGVCSRLHSVNEGASRYVQLLSSSADQGESEKHALLATCTDLLGSCLNMYNSLEEGLNFTEDVQRSLVEVQDTEALAQAVLGTLRTFALPNFEVQTSTDPQHGTCFEPIRNMFSEHVMNIELLQCTLETLREEMCKWSMSADAGVAIVYVNQDQPHGTGALANPPANAPSSNQQPSLQAWMLSRKRRRALDVPMSTPV